MKRYILALSTLLFIFSSSGWAQEVIKVGVGDGSEVYEPLIAAIYKEMNIVPQFVTVPRLRSLVNANSGEFDADIGRAAGAIGEYPNLVQVNEAIFENKLVAVVKQGSLADAPPVADLAKYKIVMIKGTKMAESFADQNGLKPASVANLVTLLRLLSADRATLGLVTSAIPIESAGADAKGLVALKTPFVTAKFLHVFNVKYANLIPKFDAVVKAMRADGRLAKLMEAATAVK